MTESQSLLMDAEELLANATLMKVTDHKTWLARLIYMNKAALLVDRACKLAFTEPYPDPERVELTS